MNPTVKFDPATGTLDIYDTRIKCINVYSRDGCKAGMCTGPYAISILPAPEPEPEPEPAPAQEPELTDFQRMVKDARKSGDWDAVIETVADEAENWEPDMDINDANNTAGEWGLNVYNSIFCWSCGDECGDECDVDEVYAGLRTAMVDRVMEILRGDGEIPETAESVINETELDYTVDLTSDIDDAINVLEDYR